MQPEDVIQAKEWAQLSEAERAVVAPLAATEGEYNVLKKLLLIAAEEAGDVPAVGPAVRQRLRAHLPRPGRARTQTIWWAAAASLLILAAAAFLLLRPKAKPDVAVQPATTPAQSKPVDTARKEPPLLLPPANETAVAQKDSLKSRPKKPVLAKGRIDNLPAIARINTSVGANENLLAFVTEAY